MIDEKTLIERFQRAGQDHVFQHIDSLTDSEKELLLTQLNDIKVESIQPLIKSALGYETSNTNSMDDAIQPFSGKIGRSTDEKLIESSRMKGMEIISHGHVAALVLAGGQGTRLGYSGPKGMFNLGLPSGFTLFQLIAERIKRLNHLASDDKCYSGLIPFYIMTSPLNHDETVSYFKKENYFGLGEDNVFFLKQGMLPCVTDGEYKIIMESACSVAMAPDGNGGIYPSLQSSGALENMKKRNIRYLHVFSIDNALVKPVDPVFIGYCVNQNADCGNKVVWKVNPDEKVGVLATKLGKPCVVEYSEITKEMTERIDNNGLLLFGAGNICNHFYSLDFIENKILPNMGEFYHIAKKKIPYYDDKSKKTIIPSEENGIKLETFIFDVFPMSERMAVLDVRRNEEFAPVKNKSGSVSDSPDIAREMISSLSKKFLMDSGADVQGDGLCEILPMTSYAGEGLEKYLCNVVQCPFII